MNKVLLTALLLLSPVPAPNVGPPERPSGRMVFDAVGAALDRHRIERDDGRWVACLRRLAGTGDPRVALALVGMADEDPDELRHFAVDLVAGLAFLISVKLTNIGA